MLIVCPTCGTTYHVGDANLGEAGRRVRCVRCAAVWVAGMPQPLASAPPKAKPAPMIEPEFAQAAAYNLGGAGPAAGATAPALHDEAGSAETPHHVTAEGDWPDRGRAAEAPPAHEAMTAPPLAPMDLDGGALRAAARPARRPVEDVESFAERRERARARRQRMHFPLGVVQMALLVLLVVNAVAIFWRSDVVRTFPQMASFYSAVGLPVNLRGLVFENVKVNRETHDGVAVLVVEGLIANVTSKTVEVPRMRFAVRNAAGQEVYTWTAVPARTVLSAGETLPFRSRLASPPPEANDVAVRFFSRRDARTGGR
jgi:predicted Zn finger-like uncharacterized protein